MRSSSPFRELDRIGFSFESGILRQSTLQLPYMGIFSHITKMQCKSTSMVVPLTISVQYDDWKSSTERTLRVPECCYRAVFFTLDHVSLSCFHCGSFSPLCCDPALTVFASKCFGAILCHDGCSLRSRGSWLGGSLVSALSCVASAPCDVALGDFVVGFWLFSCLRACVDMAQKLSFACVEMYNGLREGWHTSCYRNSSQEHIAVLLPCFLFCFVLFVWLFFVCFAFCGFCFVCFFVGLCSLSAIG